MYCNLYLLSLVLEQKVKLAIQDKKKHALNDLQKEFERAVLVSFTVGSTHILVCI